MPCLDLRGGLISFKCNLSKLIAVLTVYGSDTKVSMCTTCIPYVCVSAAHVHAINVLACICTYVSTQYTNIPSCMRHLGVSTQSYRECLWRQMGTFKLQISIYCMYVLHVFALKCTYIHRYVPLKQNGLGHGTLAAKSISHNKNTRKQNTMHARSQTMKSTRIVLVQLVCRSECNSGSFHVFYHFLIA